MILDEFNARGHHDWPDKLPPRLNWRNAISELMTASGKGGSRRGCVPFGHGSERARKVELWKVRRRSIRRHERHCSPTRRADHLNDDPTVAAPVKT